MFFNRKKNSGDLKGLQEAPLGYWEEKSYMMAIPKDKSVNLLDGIFDRVAAIEGVTLKAKSLPTGEQPGKIVFEYDGEEYTAGFFVGDFQWSEMLGMQNFYFSEDEINQLKAADKGLTIFMEFHEDCKKSFHVQLKLAVAMVPGLLGIMDESAEKMISAKWAVMAAESAVTPGPEDIYIVQAVSDKKGEVWLHTHGLCRCRLTELEILQSDRENYNNHYHLISTFASQLMDKNEPFVPGKSSKYIGMLSNGQPIVVTCVSWTEGIKEYKKLLLGGANDRQSGHNSRTSPVFVYQSEEDENAGKLSKVSVYNSMWGDNPMFFISNAETDRMQALARERFHFVREHGLKTGNKAIIKIGLVRDDDEGDSNEREHIWFELIAFEGDKFRAKLLQEPYAVAGMHEGDEGVYTVEDVTDWMIYTPEYSVKPSAAYLLA